MNRWTRDLLLLYMLALAVNVSVALLVRNPGYVDAYYYFNGGRFIAEGQGLVEPYLWNYVGAPERLPAPAFAYWQPLPSFLVALGIVLFGSEAAFGSAQAIYVILGALLPLLSYLIAAQVGERRHALLAGLLTVFSGYYAIDWSLPESFTPFALSGAGALTLVSLGRRHPRWWIFLLAGLCAGLAHLSRADGVLVIGIIGLVSLLPRASLSWGRRLAYAGVALLGYCLVMVPWLARNIAAFGSLQAPGGLSALWLNDYNDMFSYPPNLTSERFFAAGWGTILRTKWEAFRLNLATFVGVQNMVFLTPFTLITFWRRWREDWLLPAALYGLALFVAMTFAFSLPGARGGYLHSGAAMLPFIAPAAVLGLDDAVRWLARRRPVWRFGQASRVFGGAAVLFALLLTGYLIAARVVGLSDLTTVAWNSSDAIYARAGETLDTLIARPAARVMSNNPPGFYYHTGRGGVPLPNGDEVTLLRAARDYGIEYLLVDHNVPPPLESLYLEGPETDHLMLVEKYGSADRPVYLYCFVALGDCDVCTWH